MFDWMNNPQAWIAPGALRPYEVVLGIDNIFFPLDSVTTAISVAERLPVTIDGDA